MWGGRDGQEEQSEGLPLLLEAIRGLEGLSTSPLEPVEGVGRDGWSGGAVGGSWEGLQGPAEEYELGGRLHWRSCPCC